MKLNKYPVILLVTSVFLIGCTSKELYNATQNQVRINCNNKVGAEREQCLETLNQKSYKDYEQERQEIIKE